MKKIMYFIAVMFVAVGSAQNTDAIDLEKSKLNQAKAFSDKNVVLQSMYNLIALEGAESNYKDSLAYVYFDQAKYIQSFLVTEDVLKRKPENIQLLEINAISLESIGVFEKSAESYLRLFQKTNNIYHGYKQASLLFGVKKYDDALAAIKVIDAMPNTEKLEVNFQVNKTFTQQVDIKAAIAYLEGLTYAALEKSPEAEKSFNRAILIYPEFVLAKTALNNLQNLKEE